jgi:lambda family phage portal protein
LQLIEGDQVPLNLNETLTDGRYIKEGVEFDADGVRIAYHVYPEHPGELVGSSPNRSILKRIPAEEIIHVFKPLRPGQVRGEPWMSRIIVDLYELDQYQDAELVRKKTSALFAAFIEEADPENPILPSGTPSDAPTPTDTAPDGIEFISLEPGTVQKLLPGEKMTFSTPADVGGNFEAFLLSVLHKIAAGFGIPYHLMTGDLRQVNYSSLRAGLVEFRRGVEQFQFLVMVHQFCRIVWYDLLRVAVLNGELPARSGLEALGIVEWRTPRWEWVDPDKDIASEERAVQAGFKPRSATINEMGYDEEDVDEQIKRDREREKSLGLVFTTDPKHELDAKEKKRSINQPA